MTLKDRSNGEPTMVAAETVWPGERPLRVGIIAPPWVAVPPKAYGGSELMIDELARALNRSGHHVELFTTGDSTCPVRRRHVFDRAEPDQMGQVVRELRHVAAAYDRFAGFDVVHDHTTAGLYCRFRPAWLPVVSTCHGAFDVDTVELLTRAGPGVWFVAISHDQAARAPASIPVAAVVHHGINTDRYPFSEKPGDHTLFLGRMDPTKGVHVAARAARRAGLPLIIAAKMHTAAEHGYFSQFVEPLLGGDVVYVGEVDQATKLELLTSARALVNPIVWPEPFGLVMIEAMACGTPVVGYPNGAAAEIVDHGVTGFLVHDEDGLVRSLSLVDSIDRSRCRTEVALRFSAQRMATDYVAVYRQAIAGPAKVPQPVASLRLEAG